MKCNEIVKLVRYLCIYRAAVVRRFTGQRESVGVTLEIEEGVEGGSNFFLEWRGRKGVWENVDGLGSELSKSPGLSRPQILKRGTVLNTVVFELVSESM